MNSERIIPWTNDIDLVMHPFDIAYINGLHHYDDVKNEHDDDNNNNDHASSSSSSPPIVDGRKPIDVIYGMSLQRYMWYHMGVAWFHDAIWRMCVRRGSKLARSLSPSYDVTLSGNTVTHTYCAIEPAHGNE